MDMDGYDFVVIKRWNEPMVGKPMYVLWEESKGLQPILKNLSKPILNIEQNINKAKYELLTTQVALPGDRMNIIKIEHVKTH